MTAAISNFYASIPVVDDFVDAVKPASYCPLPDDWVVGFSDIVGSTAAVAKGRYKAVNMVGAGVIAAVSNALGRRPFPFVFGGDGASFAVDGADAAAASEALAAMAVFSREEYQIDLRAAVASVSTIRAGGRDVRVARFGASPHCAYAMFAGGGLSWLEARVKNGELALPPAAPGSRPDLSHLSCRWGVAPARHGLVLSVIVAPRGDDPRYGALVEEVARMAQAAADGGRPVTLGSLAAGDAAKAVQLEAAALAPSGFARAQAAAGIVAKFSLGVLFHTFRLKAGDFDSQVYAGDIAANADFRKFDDGLRMTLDCSPEFADALEKRLAQAHEFAEYGAFRQASAQITCYAPSIADRGHMHFVDGAGGGYTLAAKAMKARRTTTAA